MVDEDVELINSLVIEASEMEKRRQSLVKKAVGAHAHEGARHLAAVCAKLGLKFEMAAFEAEQHLRMLQDQGKVDIIVGYDSDYTVLGCDNVLMGRHWFSKPHVGCSNRVEMPARRARRRWRRRQKVGWLKRHRPAMAVPIL